MNNTNNTTEKETLTLTPVAHIRTDFKTKFGIPRQSGLVKDTQAQIVFTKEFRDENCFREIQDFSHLWLLWGFSENFSMKWTPTVRPPRLGGNERVGVFASRAPFRPNPIGLSCVKLEKYLPSSPDGPTLLISGADLMDGTPIYDIKPYLPVTDSHPEASQGFSTKGLSHRLTVDCPAALLEKIPEEKRQPLLDCLALDPRPSYQNDPERIYGMEFAGHDIRFHVSENQVHVVEIL